MASLALEHATGGNDTGTTGRLGRRRRIRSSSAKATAEYRSSSLTIIPGFATPFTGRGVTN